MRPSNRCARFTFRKFLLALCGASLALGAGAAPTIRLVYGKGWDEAGQKVKAMFESAAFKSAAKGRYLVECIDFDEAERNHKNLGSLKLPVMYVISEQGNCFFVKENMPANVGAEQVLGIVARVDKARLAAEKKGWASADACGEFLERMERFVGGAGRVVSRGYYDNVFAKLKSFDPADETGWQRHFTMGDGIDLVIKANEFREKGATSQGAAFIEAEKKKARKHLTKEQQQAILMAQFALYREDTSKREQLIGFLSKVAAAGEDTLWGTSALGWLNIMGAPPLSVYWGWHQGDFKGSPFKATIRYGVDCSFAVQGKYTISFIKQSGVSLKIDSVTLYAGKDEVATLKNPTVSGDTTSFDFELKRAHRGRLTAMEVKGSSDPSGGSTGRIEIRRHVLKPRKDA